MGGVRVVLAALLEIVGKLLMKLAGIRSLIVPVALALALGACSTPANYLGKRVYDLQDMVDMKYGCEFDGFALGAKLEATNYIGVGAGYGEIGHVTEQYGRRASEGHMEFLHLVVYGMDGPHDNHVPGPNTEFSIVGINCCQEKRPPWVDRFRFGGEVALIGLSGGLYLNVGEVVDFVGGIFTWDPAKDDEMAWNTPW